MPAIQKSYVRRVAPFLLAFSLLAGCNKPADPNDATSVNPTDTSVQVHDSATPTTDDANLVLAQCGRPSSDSVLAIFNKMNNGPVRRVVYNRMRQVTIDFIPSVPVKRPENPAERRAVRAELPVNAVWRFDEARVPHEMEMVTAARIEFFLPCAAQALRAEY